MRLKYFLFLSLAWSACQPKSSDSQLDYVHAPASQATISPIGGIQILRSDLAFEKDVYDVCVRGGNASISDESLLLETKLAYAAWLASAGYGADEWSLFSFRLQDTCPDSQQHLAAVVLMDLQRDAGEQELRAFQEARIRCQRRGYSYSCGTQSGAIGRGRWGGASYSYDPRSGKWLAIRGFSQVRATFSPYVDWYSLRDDLMNMKDIDEALRQNLIEDYEALLIDDSFAKLQSFNQSLEDEQLISAGDLAFAELFRQFQQDNASSLDVAYRSKLGLFHVMLHEIGHNFGMQHSHVPAPDGYIEVETENLRVEVDGRTKFLSTMAYDDSYLFLAADDKAGIQSMRAQTEAFFASKL